MLVPIVYWPISSDRLVVIPMPPHTIVEWLLIHGVVATAAPTCHCHFLQRANPRNWMIHRWSVGNASWSSRRRRRVLVDRLLACINESLPSAINPLWLSTIDIWLVRRPFASPRLQVHLPIRLVYAVRTIPGDRDSIPRRKILFRYLLCCVKRREKRLKQDE